MEASWLYFFKINLPTAVWIDFGRWGRKKNKSYKLKKETIFFMSRRPQVAPVMLSAVTICCFVALLFGGFAFQSRFFLVTFLKEQRARSYKGTEHHIQKHPASLLSDRSFQPNSPKSVAASMLAT